MSTFGKTDRGIASGHDVIEQADVHQFQGSLVWEGRHNAKGAAPRGMSPGNHVDLTSHYFRRPVLMLMIASPTWLEDR
jgi:hypothetical protein